MNTRTAITAWAVGLLLLLGLVAWMFQRSDTPDIGSATHVQGGTSTDRPPIETAVTGAGNRAGHENADGPASPTAQRQDGPSNGDAKQIATGFLFLNGCYVQSPYRFTISDQGLYVNGQKLRAAVKRPTLYTGQSKPPRLPEDRSRFQTTYDEWEGEPIGRVLQKHAIWLHATLAREDALAAIVELYTSFSFVESVSWATDFGQQGDFLRVAYGNGRSVVVEVRPPAREELPAVVADPNRQLQHVRDRYSNFLVNGCLVYSSTQGIEIVVPHQQTVPLLQRLVAVLASDVDLEAKQRAIVRTGFFPKAVSESVVMELLGNYRPDQQLSARLRALGESKETE
jgi:hypothetical protein